MKSSSPRGHDIELSSQALWDRYFCEEAREFIQKANPDREVLVISHTDGEGEGVFPIIDMSRHDWWKPVAEKVKS